MMRSVPREWLIGIAMVAGCAEPPPAPVPKAERPAVTIIASPPIEAEPAGGPAATTPADPVANEATTAAASATNPPDASWQALFDGAELGGWQKSSFGGAGDVTVEDGAIRIPMGVDLAGVTFSGEFPTQDYELALDARRVDGNDFFCGLTFPVADSHCSLILGGWGGGVVGLSCIDGEDAANNATTKVMSFTEGRWYAVRVKVTPDRITCFLDDERIVDQPLTDCRISVREEVVPSQPLGIATYATTAELRNIRWRPTAAPVGEP